MDRAYPVYGLYIVFLCVVQIFNNNNEYVFYSAIPRKNELNALNYKCTTDECK